MKEGKESALALREATAQIRTAIAQELVVQSIPRVCEALAAFTLTALQDARDGRRPTREQLDLLRYQMARAGLGPRQAPESDKADVSRLSLADLEKMIGELEIQRANAAKDVTPRD